MAPGVLTPMSPNPRASPMKLAASERTPTSGRVGSFVSRGPSACVPSGVGNHPVEVVGRIREHPEGGGKESAIRVQGANVVVRAHALCREFTLDGVSQATTENLLAFYLKYVEARVEDVKSGGRCTIMMYGPTGAGKSYTMFGSACEKGVASHALQQLMSCTDSSGDGEAYADQGVEVRATVWEIYNEEIFDLLSNSENSSTFGSLFKISGHRAKLEMMGRKVKKSMSLTGTDPEKLIREISALERKRIVKSTNCNDRSSRSHCLVTIDIPAVGGKLVLVDMAGSENIEQAGLGKEFKLQTGKINKGNGALKRVVEAIANNDSHIPYRDSKLTTLLQDSFEDDGAKILMILCASPDIRDLHKTLCTFEYGAKAKCIVRLPNSPPKEQSALQGGKTLGVLEACISQKDIFIRTLREDNKWKERELENKNMELEKRERELTDLRERGNKWREELELEMEQRVHEKSKAMWEEMVLKMERNGKTEDQHVADEDSEIGRRRIEELEALVGQQQRLIDVMRVRAEKAEAELLHLQRSYSCGSNAQVVDLQVESDPGKLLGYAGGGNLVRALDLPSETSVGKLPPCSQSPRELQVEVGGACNPLPAENETTEEASVIVHVQDLVKDIIKGSTDDQSHGGFQSVASLDFMHPCSTVQPKVEDDTPRPILGTSDFDRGGGSSVTSDDQKEPLTWSEERLHRKGWLPPIFEEEYNETKDPVKVCNNDASVSEVDTSEDSEASSSSPIHSTDTGSSDPDSNASWHEAVSPRDLHRDTFLSMAKDELDVAGLYPSTDGASTNCQDNRTSPDLTELSGRGHAWIGYDAVGNVKEEPVTDIVAGTVQQSCHYVGAAVVPFVTMEECSGGVQDAEEVQHFNITHDVKVDVLIDEVRKERYPAISADVGGFLGGTQEDDAHNALKVDVQKDAKVKSETYSASPAAYVDVKPLLGGTQEDDGLHAWKAEHGIIRHDLPADAMKAEIKSEPYLATSHALIDVSPVGRGHKRVAEESLSKLESTAFEQDHSAAARRARIETIFMLCGDRREIAARRPPSPPKIGYDAGEPVNWTCANSTYEDDGEPVNLGSANSTDEDEGEPENLASGNSTCEDRNTSDMLAGSPHLMGRLSHNKRQPVSVPSPSSWTRPSHFPRESPTQGYDDSRQASVSPCPSETAFTDISLPSPLPSVSPQWLASPCRPKRSFLARSFANENVPEQEYQKEKCDVYVKWEASKDSAGGKLICIINTVKSASLADLRKEVEAHIPIARRNFAFLILGEIGGAPVDQELEMSMRVVSLPDCLNNRCSRLACLRPPLTHTLFVTPFRAGVPFRPLENQMNTLSSGTSSSKTKSGKKSVGINAGKASYAQAQARGLRVQANGIGARPALTFKEKASLAHVQEIASKFLC